MTTPLPEHRDLSVSLPWQVQVGAKRLARQRGLTLDAYVEGLINADLATEAAVIRRLLAEEEAQLRAEREAGEQR